jgi:hypothetical protein
VHCIDRIYEVGDKVILQVKLHKISIKFGKGEKLSPRFMGPFNFLEKKGLMAYRIALHDSLRHFTMYFMYLF